MPKQTLSVLVVAVPSEDLNEILSILEKADDPFFHIQQASSLGSSIDILKMQAFDLILLDLNLTGKSSLHPFYDLRSRNADVPIIAIADDANESLALQMLARGGQDFITKGHLIAARLIRSLQFAVERHKRLIDARRGHDHVVKAVGEKSTYIEGMESVNIGDYRLLQCIGEGAISTVFMAEANKQGIPRRVALKVLKPSALMTDDGINWQGTFEREATNASKVRHPNVIRIFETGQDPTVNGAFIAMEYVDGADLSRCHHFLGDIDMSAKLSIILQTAEALKAIHGCGLCHLDIKPENILITRRGEAKVTDFGISRPVDDKDDFPIVGSPAYMAPECYENQRPDTRSDLFSLGVVMYEWLLDQRPFPAKLPQRLRDQILTGRPPEPSKLQSDFPMIVQDIIAKLLKKDWDKRYTQASDLISDLKIAIPSLEASEKKRLTSFSGRLLNRDWA